MKVLRVLLGLVVVAALAFLFYRYVLHRAPAAADKITVYYCETDGETLAPWTVTLGPARDPRSVAFYATAQVLAGPPAGTAAIRFPPGTFARRVEVAASLATVDLNRAVESQSGGSFGEGAEFKALVWTLTGLGGIDKVQVLVEGRRIASLPGGHLELDRPLSRSDWQ